jgi:hypothetical protein
VNYTDKPFRVAVKDEAIITGKNPLQTASAIVWKNR